MQTGEDRSAGRDAARDGVEQCRAQLEQALKTADDHGLKPEVGAHIQTALDALEEAHPG